MILINPQTKLSIDATLFLLVYFVKTLSFLLTWLKNGGVKDFIVTCNFLRIITFFNKI